MDLMIFILLFKIKIMGAWLDHSIEHRLGAVSSSPSWVERVLKNKILKNLKRIK